MKISSLLSRALFACSVLATASACAAPITFSFSDDASNYYFFGRTHVAGKVTGILNGLSANGNNQLPTSIVFTSGTEFLGLTDLTLDGNNNLFFWDARGFNVANGVITGGGFGLNFTDPEKGSEQLRLNSSDGYNLLFWNGANSTIVGKGNLQGFGGATYGASTSVPEPAPLALLGAGAAALAWVRRRRRAG